MLLLFQTSYIFNINIYNNINTIYFIIIKKYSQKLLSSKIIITCYKKLWLIKTYILNKIKNNSKLLPKIIFKQNNKYFVKDNITNKILLAKQNKISIEIMTNFLWIYLMIKMYSLTDFIANNLLFPIINLLNIYELHISNLLF